jgi:hypothetical protein
MQRSRHEVLHGRIKNRYRLYLEPRTRLVNKLHLRRIARSGTYRNGTGKQKSSKVDMGRYVR